MFSDVLPIEALCTITGLFSGLIRYTLACYLLLPIFLQVPDLRQACRKTTVLPEEWSFTGRLEGIWSIAVGFCSLGLCFALFVQMVI
jgi:hypothetical protein